jgi:GNAT superfamily N-acetyltransferase
MIKLLDFATADLAVKIAELSYQLGYETNTQETLARLSYLISSKENCIFIAITNGEIVGWIHGFYTVRVESAAFVEIAGLVVDQNYRGQNIGKNLIEAVKNWAASLHVGIISVRCKVIRIESHKFYKRLGFELNKQQMVFRMKI